MPRTPTTPAQISGYRFLFRRIEHALVRADAAMLHDPMKMRIRGLIVGAVLVILLGAGTAIFGLVRPTNALLNNANIVVTVNSSGMYVRLNDRLHPVENLASARLILGSAEVPQQINSEAVIGENLGFPVGIPGAPEVVGKPEQIEQRKSSGTADGLISDGSTSSNGQHGRAPTLSLGVCDSVVRQTFTPASQQQEITWATSATVVRLREANNLTGLSEFRSTKQGIPSQPDAPLEQELSVLGWHDGKTWFIHGGRRSQVDMKDPVITRALGLTEEVARPISPALLRSIPQLPDLSRPTIAEAGIATGFPSPFDEVGNIVRVDDRVVVTMKTGAAAVSPVVGEILSSAGASYSASKQELAAIPVAENFQPPSLPSQKPRWWTEPGWLCADSTADQTVLSMAPGTSLGAFPGGAVSEYPHADGGGTGVDGYSHAPGYATVPVLVDGAPQLISSTGVRYPVESRRAVTSLGYDNLEEVPWRAFSALREGPELSRASALQPADGLPRPR